MRPGPPGPPGCPCGPRCGGGRPGVVPGGGCGPRPGDAGASSPGLPFAGAIMTGTRCRPAPTRAFRTATDEGE
ncbi:hypothetical protein DDE74_17190 [Streptomyces lydicus]|uniref:Uncharacterized protein n=1 Tax=Streptomyces lydicus TaxID=47763 RepID=A0A3Q9KAP4_9ACTN|nr:hypothetical protein DDE74_17190 [Streptomyces lydicus]